jgi:hypothetical protein
VQNREELRIIGFERSQKQCVARGGKISFLERGGAEKQECNFSKHKIYSGGNFTINNA